MDAFIADGNYLINGGTLDLASFDLSMARLSGTDGEVALGSADLTIAQAGNTEFAGVLSGTGDVAKEGAGELMLSGTSTFTGLTFVNEGLLTVDGSIASSSGLEVATGGILGGAGFVPSTSVAGTLAPGNSIGALTVDGDLTLAAGSTYAAEADAAGSDLADVTGTADLAGTTVTVDFALDSYAARSYTLVTAAGGLVGTVYDLAGSAPLGFDMSLQHDAGALYLMLDAETPVGRQFDIADPAAVNTLNQSVDGSGGLIKTGPGTLILAGANSYTGGTFVTEGTLRAGTADAFVQNTSYAVNGGTLDLNGFNLTMSDFYGTGGQLALGTAKLTVDQTGDGSFAGSITGTGAFIKMGNGKLLLTGISSYTGATQVNAGLLSVNGDISSSSGLVVGPGGTIGGNGRLPTTRLDGGTLAPGNSIGTLTVAGPLIFGTGSVYAVEVDPVSADQTIVIGSADLSGGTVVTSYATGNYIARNYTILSASGGLGGTEFAALQGVAPAGFKQELAYGAGTVSLELDLLMREGSGSNNSPGDSSGTGLGGTDGAGIDFDSIDANARAVANAIVGYFDANGGIPAEFAALDPKGLTAVSGEPAAAAIHAGIESADRFLDLLSGQALSGRGPRLAPPQPIAYAAQDKDQGRFDAMGIEDDRLAAIFDTRWESWGGAYGGTLSIDGNRAIGSHDLQVDTFGLAGGLSRRWDDTTFGFALGGGSSSFDLSDGLGGGNATIFNAGLMARQDFGDFYLSGVVAYGFNDVKLSRTASTDMLSGEFDAHSFAGRVEAGYGIDTPVALFTPYAAFQVIGYRMPGFSETGTGSFALTYQGDTTIVTRTELGARLDRTIGLRDGADLVLSGRAALAINGGGDVGYTASFQSLPGTSFAIAGASPDRYAALLDVNAEYRSQSGLYGAVGVQGELSQNMRSLSGKARIGFRW